jgi:hypothetical protein
VGDSGSIRARKAGQRCQRNPCCPFDAPKPSLLGGHPGIIVAERSRAFAEQIVATVCPSGYCYWKCGARASPANGASSL